MNQKSLKRNAVLNAVKQCCQILFPLITFPYISRILGNDGYGKYSFSYSITNYFILLAALGINTYAIREGAKIREDKDRLNNFCSQIFSINVCSAMFSFALLGLLLVISPKIRDYTPYVLIQSTAIIMTVIGTDWINSIYEDYLYITIRYIAIQAICMIMMFVFVRTNSDIIPYCLISVLASYGGNLLNILYVRKYARVQFTFRMDFKRHIVPLLILFSNSIAISIYVSSDITVLGFFESDSIVGVYSFAAKIYNLLKAVINAVIVVSLPRISYIIVSRSKEYELYINKIFSALTIILLPIVTGMFFMSDSLIVLAGGESYLSGNIALKILSIATIFAIYASLFTNCVLIVNRQEKKCLQATICSALINIVLNFILIPRTGMNGAAVATVIAEIINCAFQMYFGKNYINFQRFELKGTISCLVGSVFIGFICIICNIYLSNSIIKLFIAVLFSGVAYGLVLLKLKNNFLLGMIAQAKTRRKKEN